MKKISVIAIFVLCVTSICSAQIIDTIYTRGGKPVQVQLCQEMSDDLVAFWNEYYSTWFPDAVLLENSSERYNCHSYAWYLTDNGSLVCWLEDSVYYFDGSPNQPNVSKYWTNDYYQQTVESDALKIHYYNGNHSAVASPTVSGMYESKWGIGPVMRHAPERCPYPNKSDRNYYNHIVVNYGTITCSNVSSSIGVNIAANYTAPSPNNTSSFVWVIETAKGDDAVELGRAVINSQSGSSANVTFTSAGLYEMCLYCYNPFNVLLGVYTLEQIVV